MVGLALRQTVEDHRFVRLASARAISVLGNGFSRVALAFGVLSLPGATPARLSIVLACQAIPQLLFVLVGGVVADRVSRYRLMVGAELLAGCAWLTITAMIFTGYAPLPFLGLAAVVAGVGTALFLPALNGVLPEFVSGERLQSANALLRIGQNSAMVLGLSLSGLVVATAGAGWALAVNAASFFISAALIWGMKLPARSRAARTSTLAELRHGWAEFASRQWLWVVVAQFAIVIAAVNATVGVLGPLEMTDSGGGAATWGLLVAAQSLGAIAGAGLATRVQARRPILVAVVATLTFGLPMLALGVGAPLWLSVAAMFACGIGSDIFDVLWTTTMQREIPEESISRVSAYDIFGSLAFAPLGLLLAGPIAALIGPRAALLGCAGLVTAATVAALASPAVRRLTAPTLVSGPPRTATETD